MGTASVEIAEVDPEGSSTVKVLHVFSGALLDDKVELTMSDQLGIHFQSYQSEIHTSFHLNQSRDQ